MENKTNFELITPSQRMISQEIEMVVIPGSEGHFGVLPLHSHTLSTLNRGIVTLYENGSSIDNVIIDGGIADVTPSGCSILVERAENLNDLKQSEIQNRLNNFKSKEKSFENPAEEKANSDEIDWLEFVLSKIKN